MEISLVNYDIKWAAMQPLEVLQTHIYCHICHIIKRLQNSIYKINLFCMILHILFFFEAHRVPQFPFTQVWTDELIQNNFDNLSNQHAAFNFFKSQVYWGVIDLLWSPFLLVYRTFASSQKVFFPQLPSWPWATTNPISFPIFLPSPGCHRNEIIHYILYILYTV